MGSFTLDTSTLAGSQFRSQYVGMDGEFREIQMRFTQAVSNQDFELHFLEFHMELAGVSEE